MSLDREEILRTVRELQLPVGHYVVTGSGSLGVRGIRAANDVDIQADEHLWRLLEDRFGPSEERLSDFLCVRPWRPVVDVQSGSRSPKWILRAQSAAVQA